MCGNLVQVLHKILQAREGPAEAFRSASATLWSSGDACHALSLE